MEQNLEMILKQILDNSHSTTDHPSNKNRWHRNMMDKNRLRKLKNNQFQYSVSIWFRDMGPV